MNYWELTESHERETEDSLSRHVDLVLTGPPFNVRSEVGKASSKHEVFTREDIRDQVEL